MLFVLIGYYSNMLAPAVGLRPESHPSILATLYFTALACSVLIPAMIITVELFKLEKEEIKTGYVKYLALGLVFVLLISLTALSFYDTQEYVPPTTYSCDLAVTSNSTSWVITINHSSLPADGVTYILMNGENHNLLEFGNPMNINSGAPSGYNIVFFDANNDSHINNGDFFIIQKSGGIDGTAKSGDFFYLEMQGEEHIHCSWITLP